MRFYLLLSLVCLCTSPVAAQERTSAESDPYDLSSITARIEESGVPSPTAVTALETQAQTAFDAGECRAAVPALVEFGKAANWLSNLIAAGLEPYYNATSSGREDLPARELDRLVRFERTGNEYKSKRNKAMVMQAECEAKLGNRKEAAALYIRALDLIAIRERELWERARTGLYTLVGVLSSGQ